METKFAGQILMMSLDQGRYYALEAIAKRIWDLLEVPTALGEVVDRLLGEFEVDRARCEAEVLAFAKQLLDNRLINIT